MATGFDYMDMGTRFGLPPDLARFVPRFIQIESGGDPNAVTGSYRGLLQMGPAEQAKYGGIGLEHGIRMYADNYNWFKRTYGRDPSASELYMIAQQGRGGSSAHMMNPDAPAWQNMLNTAEGRQKGEAWAKQAIWGNVPDSIKKQFPGGVESLTSKQFADLWKNKVENVNLPLSAGGTPSEQSAQAAPQNYDAIKGYLDSERRTLFEPVKLSGTAGMLQPFEASFKGAAAKQALSQYIDGGGLKTSY